MTKIEIRSLECTKINESETETENGSTIKYTYTFQDDDKENVVTLKTDSQKDFNIGQMVDVDIGREKITTLTEFEGEDEPEVEVKIEVTDTEPAKEIDSVCVRCKKNPCVCEDPTEEHIQREGHEEHLKRVEELSKTEPETDALCLSCHKPLPKDGSECPTCPPDHKMLKGKEPAKEPEEEEELATVHHEDENCKVTCGLNEPIMSVSPEPEDVNCEECLKILKEQKLEEIPEPKIDVKAKDPHTIEAGKKVENPGCRFYHQDGLCANSSQENPICTGEDCEYITAPEKEQSILDTKEEKKEKGSPSTPSKEKEEPEDEAPEDAPDFLSQIYEYPTTKKGEPVVHVIGVQEIGGEYSTFWRSEAGGLRKIKTAALPFRATIEEAQHDLQEWAVGKKLKMVEYNQTEGDKKIEKTLNDAKKKLGLKPDLVTEDEIPKKAEQETLPEPEEEPEEEVKTLEDKFAEETEPEHSPHCGLCAVPIEDFDKHIESEMHKKNLADPEKMKEAIGGQMEIKEAAENIETETSLEGTILLKATQFPTDNLGGLEADIVIERHNGEGFLYAHAKSMVTPANGIQKQKYIDMLKQKTGYDWYHTLDRTFIADDKQLNPDKISKEESK